MNRRHCRARGSNKGDSKARKEVEEKKTLKLLKAKSKWLEKTSIFSGECKVKESCRAVGEWKNRARSLAGTLVRSGLAVVAL